MATFRGNIVDLGSKFGGARLVELLFPNPRQAYPKTFRYPKERLFRLRGIIPDEDMSHPTGTDEHGDSCLFVMKKGRSRLDEPIRSGPPSAPTPTRKRMPHLGSPRIELTWPTARSPERSLLLATPEQSSLMLWAA